VYTAHLQPAKETPSSLVVCTSECSTQWFVRLITLALAVANFNWAASKRKRAAKNPKGGVATEARGRSISFKHTTLEGAQPPCTAYLVPPFG
jgi:hypothetical protein